LFGKIFQTNQEFICPDGLGMLSVNVPPMKLKSIFGALLTLLGAAGLIYAAYLYINQDAGTKSLITYGVLGLIFFLSGIGLIKKLD
jgi:hypothetical protein